MNIWQILEIEPTKDLSIIKQAYATKLKANKPETNPDGFKILRRAYEIAQQYSHDDTVSTELDEVNKAQPHQDSIDPHQNKNNAASYVHCLLDILEQEGDKKAIETLDSYKDKQLFLNLDFREKFEYILALNLLSMSIHYEFMLSVFEFFNWSEKVEQSVKDSIFLLAINNLDRQMKPYNFCLYLRYISNIKNKRQAKKENIAWENCFAAKQMFSKSFRFISLKCFFIGKKKKAALCKLVEIIYNDFPQTFSMGINPLALAHWHNYFSKSGINIVAITLITIYGVAMLMNAGGDIIKHFVEGKIGNTKDSGLEKLVQQHYTSTSQNTISNPAVNDNET